MNPENDRKYIKVKKATLLIAILIVGAGVVGWQLGRSDKTPSTPANIPAGSTEVNNTNTAAVKSLVTYTLPDGWKEASCSAVTGAVFVIPNGSSGVDCNANPSAPIKISIDPGSHKDCNELQNVQNVKKHVCISLFINGQRSLKASTEYLSSSSYNKATTIDAYYIDTGKGVIKVENIYNSDNPYQIGFDQLANSIKTKS